MDEQCIVLGNMTYSEYKAMEQNPGYRFTHDQLTRISYIMGIHSALCTLPIGHSKQNIRRWLRESQKPEYAPLFDGKSALTKILSGELTDLADVRYYLDTFCC